MIGDDAKYHTFVVVLAGKHNFFYFICTQINKFDKTLISKPVFRELIRHDFYAF